MNDLDTKDARFELRKIPSTTFVHRQNRVYIHIAEKKIQRRTAELKESEREQRRHLKIDKIIIAIVWCCPKSIKDTTTEHGRKFI